MTIRGLSFDMWCIAIDPIGICQAYNICLTIVFIHEFPWIYGENNSLARNLSIENIENVTIVTIYMKNNHLVIYGECGYRT